MSTEKRDSVRSRSLDDFVGDEESFDFTEMMRALLHKAWVVLICLIVGGAVTGAAFSQLITPKYESVSMIYVYSKTTSITSLADLQIGTQLAVDFQIVATTHEVIEQVINKLNLNTTYSDLVKHVSISNPSGSHILKIKATSTDPVQAANISNALAEELRGRIADVMNTDEPSVVERAVVPKEPAGLPTIVKAVLGGLVCALAAAVIICISFILDDTIKTDQDVRRYLNLNTLAAVPQIRGYKQDKDEPKKKASAQ